MWAIVLVELHALWRAKIMEIRGKGVKGQMYKGLSCEKGQKVRLHIVVTVILSLPYATLCNPTQPYPTLPNPTQSYPTLRNPYQPYLTLPNPTQPYATLPNPMQPYATLCNPTQPYTTLPNPAQPYPFYCCCLTERKGRTEKFSGLMWARHHFHGKVSGRCLI